MRREVELQEVDWTAFPKPSEEMQSSWLLQHSPKPKKKTLGACQTKTTSPGEAIPVFKMGSIQGAATQTCLEVGSEGTERYCWMRPEDIDYERHLHLLWGGVWLYYATGDATYLALAAPSDSFSRDSGVFSWNTKLAGAQLLLTRMRLFLSPGYPAEEVLRKFHNQISIVMCSYLPSFNKFDRTKGGLIQLNNGDPQPLQYAANAAFLAALYGDYLEASDTRGWSCGPNVYFTNVLRDFSRSQVSLSLHLTKKQSKT
ncbi:hypothetical protein F2Q70_00028669 [Brassica cretica]|uniref:cellulase n=1 Tax=Brassica cretica TaxID=69181 RepID=A0A8S9LD91_BRACR|nr:hypothetical protein F2Q70_00028669 [Brassica cretica]